MAQWYAVQNLFTGFSLRELNILPADEFEFSDVRFKTLDKHRPRS